MDDYTIFRRHPDISEQDYNLTPGRYVGVEDDADDGEDYEIKMERLSKAGLAFHFLM